MHYSMGTSHPGFPLENGQGNGDDGDQNDDSPPASPSLAAATPARQTSLSCTTHGGTTMNSEELPSSGQNRESKKSPTGFWRGTATADDGML